jgi:hypothetical protein
VDTGLPECDVLLNGEPVGKTGPDGVVSISGLSVGSYQVSVRKRRYFDHNETVYLSVSGATSSARLTLAVGSLNLTTNVSGATLEVPGYGSFNGSILGLELPSGTYVVSAKAPNFTATRRSITITAGQVTTETLQLGASVPDFINSMATALMHNNSEAARDVAHELLKRVPDSGYGYRTLAEVAANTGDKAEFLGNLRLAIENGVTVSFQYLHVHNAKTRHPVKLEIGGSSLQLDTFAFPCGLARYSNLALSLHDAKLNAQKGKEPSLELDLDVPRHGWVKAQLVSMRQVPGAISKQDEYDVLRRLLLDVKADRLRARRPQSQPIKSPVPSPTGPFPPQETCAVSVPSQSSPSLQSEPGSAAPLAPSPAVSSIPAASSDTVALPPTFLRLLSNERHGSQWLVAVPKTGMWYDTGIPVAANQELIVRRDPGALFSLRVGDHTYDEPPVSMTADFSDTVKLRVADRCSCSSVILTVIIQYEERPRDLRF